MPLFKPNLTCEHRKPAGMNVYGEERLGDPVIIGCAIIKMMLKNMDSSVRADSSASRGAAIEQQLEGKILVEPTSNVEIDDQLVIDGIKVRVQSKFPRHSLSGKLDHYELTIGLWGKK